MTVSRLVDRDQDEELNDFLQELEKFMTDDGEKEVELPLLFTHHYPPRLLHSQIAEFRARWDANSDDEARNKLIEEEAGRKKEVKAVRVHLALLESTRPHMPAVVK